MRIHLLVMRCQLNLAQWPHNCGLDNFIDVPFREAIGHVRQLFPVAGGNVAEEPLTTHLYRHVLEVFDASGSIWQRDVHCPLEALEKAVVNIPRLSR